MLHRLESFYKSLSNVNDKNRCLEVITDEHVLYAPAAVLQYIVRVVFSVVSCHAIKGYSINIILQSVKKFVLGSIMNGNHLSGYYPGNCF